MAASDLSIRPYYSWNQVDSPLNEGQLRLDWEDNCCRRMHRHSQAELVHIVDKVEMATLQLGNHHDTEDPSYDLDLDVDTSGIAGMVDGAMAAGRDIRMGRKEVKGDMSHVDQGPVHDNVRRGKVAHL